MEVKLLYIAEIVGKAGISCVKQIMPKIKAEYGINFCIANADSATNGSGLGKNHAGYIHKLGVDVLTGGDMIFYKKDLVDDLSSMSYVLRPYNFPPESPGRSYKICTLIDGTKIAVVSVLGYTGFNRIHADNPFVRFESLVERLKKDADIVIIDFHSGTTAEKKTFAFFADGQVSAVIGSHGLVQTADPRIMPNGTAAITDAGRTGCINSVGGCGTQAAIQEFLSGIPNWTKGEEMCLETLPELQGVVVTIAENGKATAIEALCVPLY